MGGRGCEKWDEEGNTYGGLSQIMIRSYKSSSQSNSWMKEKGSLSLYYEFC